MTVRVQPVRFIAEVSSNHNGSLERALRFVDVAADAGCAAVKFQLFRVDQLFSPEIVAKNPDVQARKAWELPLEFLPSLSERAQQRGIEFCCTPFYLEAVEQLKPYVDFYKIASYELLWHDLLAACAETGKPVMISTGMATLEEIKSAVNCLRKHSAQDIRVLHCVSNYPTQAEECNLAFIAKLQQELNVPIGWSDHSVNSAVIQRAVHRWGVRDIEFHLDLDEAGFEFGGKHCWLPQQVENVISELEQSFIADGSAEKLICEAEQNERDWRADPVDGLRPLQHMRATYNYKK